MWVPLSCLWVIWMSIFGGPMITLGLTGKSLSAVKWELMKPTQRPSVSLMTETGMFLWMPSSLISGGPLLSLRCSARVCHCLCLLVRVVDCVWVGWYDWSAVELFWQQTVQGGRRSASFYLPSIYLSYHLCLQVQWGQASLVRLGSFWWHWPVGYVSSFSEEYCWCYGPSVLV